MGDENPENTYIPTKRLEMTDLLYIHPAEGSHPVEVEPKLSGMENYNEWKRQMELELACRRKLEILTGKVKRPRNDPIRESAWDTCNSLLITWLLHNIDKPIKRSGMYTGTTKEIWDYLNRQFSVANGARKYRLNKDLSEMVQGSKSITEYFTELKILWENLEIMEDSPPLTEINAETGRLMTYMFNAKEEQRLFQFLNGLDISFSTMRSNLLMMSPLPSVEAAAAMFQQEEAQRKNVINPIKMEIDTTTFYVKQKRQEDTSQDNSPWCPECKKKGHTRATCWWVVGFPEDHPKTRGPGYKPLNSKYHGGSQSRSNKGTKPWVSKGKQAQPSSNVRTAANAQSDQNMSNAITLTSEQFDRLMSNRSDTGKRVGSYPHTEDELEANFAGFNLQTMVCYGTLCIRMHKRRDTFVRVDRSEPLLGQLKRHFSNGGKLVSTCFVYNGLKLTQLQTVDQLLIQDGEIIDAFNFAENSSSLSIITPIRSKLLTLKVKNRDGKVFALKTEGSTLLSVVAYKFACWRGLSSSDVILRFNGRKLSLYKTVKAEHLVDGCQIDGHLIREEKWPTTYK